MHVFDQGSSLFVYLSLSHTLIFNLSLPQSAFFFFPFFFKHSVTNSLTVRFKQALQKSADFTHY